ncbi:hypothetical protein SAMN03080615_00070 [Amphritea atlantica]|uniref:Uncharacterized protein n=1 Tax=Amphritea atlantica TaxID=355243 RepID=A0A1H9CPN4_9GAMM|nr:hypothetical protein [Amphritea atlantica]SEQ02588.1 hypothetical protein SAMN03080615_00070 [Amphritea atlantica]
MKLKFLIALSIFFSSTLFGKDITLQCSGTEKFMPATLNESRSQKYLIVFNPEKLKISKYLTYISVFFGAKDSDSKYELKLNVSDSEYILGETAKDKLGNLVIMSSLSINRYTGEASRSTFSFPTGMVNPVVISNFKGDCHTLKDKKF